MNQIKKKLLLHTCCAPCISNVYETLKDEYDITAFFYNPNIAPQKEYVDRLTELLSFSQIKKFNVIEGDYNIRHWTSFVSKFKYNGEKSERCWLCYRFRLEETFKKAQKDNFDVVTTVLSISPHKNAQKINEIGLELQEKYNIEFYVADFKKKDGFKKSIELSKKYGFYRQNYCGCIYSRLEREKNPGWLKAIEKNSNLNK